MSDDSTTDPNTLLNMAWAYLQDSEYVEFTHSNVNMVIDALEEQANLIPAEARAEAAALQDGTHPRCQDAQVGRPMGSEDAELYLRLTGYAQRLRIKLVRRENGRAYGWPY